MAASKHTNVQARSENGTELSVQHTSTDSPILPAENLRQLQLIDPALVTWVISQTEKEADHRRSEERRVNFFILTERLSGMFLGAFIALTGLGLSAYLIMQGHDVAGVALGGTGLASIVSVLVARHNVSKNASGSAVAANRRPTQKRSQATKLPPKKS